MNTRFRTAIILATVCSALALGGVAAAGTGGMVGDVAREAKEKEKARDAGQPAPQRPHEQRAPQARVPQPQVRAPEARAVVPAPQQRNYSGGDGTVLRSQRTDRGVIGNLADRTADRTIERRDNRANFSGGHRPPRYVNTLPGGYRQYNWNGRPYYNYGGSWYRPYGNRYVVVGAPYGLFVSFLPSYYSSFWFGGTRYFYADDTYYLYEPEQHGYVVTRSPYASERDDEESSMPVDDDLYIYPSKGQSEQQQADDKYDCHRWAAKETGYDPIDSNSDTDQRAGYLRAMTACLTGRGYSVK